MLEYYIRLLDIKLSYYIRLLDQTTRSDYQIHILE